MRKLVILLLCSISLGLQAQYAPTFYTQLKVLEKYGVTQTDFPARFQINTQTFIAQSQMNSSGNDIRFTLGCPGNYLSYWIESGINTDSTVIWVRIPSLTADDTLDLNMFFGDPLAPPASDFASTFPNALNTTGNVTISGTQNYGYLKVNAGHTLTLQAGSPVTINAEYAEINGIISGAGKGWLAPATASAGTGPGGGGTSTNSGCGGGGYGGAGGMGGYDSGDTPGIGGVANGTSNGTDIAMGSSGGTSDNTAGGNGGGSLTLRSGSLVLSGTINLDGNPGLLPGGARGGGGGAGGGMLIFAERAQISGSLSCKGGDGSIGTSTANDSGGGGGGGRIKIFHGTAYSYSGTSTVVGGIGGPYGGAAGGANGAAGSLHSANIQFKQNMVLGTYSYLHLNTMTQTICQGDSIMLGGAYQSTAGTYYDTLTNIIGCDSIVQTTLSVTPVDTSVTRSGFTLTAQASPATYQWYNCSTQASIPGATAKSYTVNSTGSYACLVTQNACTDMSSCYYVIYSAGVDETGLKNLKIFPNPAQSDMAIQGLAAGISYEISICDLTGRVHASYMQPGGSANVDVTSLPKGAYLLSITDLSSSESRTFHVLKN